MSIPKKIHFCWFGGKPKPAIFQKCLDSWQRYAPDYEIAEWNESTFDVQAAPFARDALAHRAWAFVSDYVRAWALFHHGGIYLDTDCELRAPLDDFLRHRAFSGFQERGFPFTALWGSEAGHPWPAAVLDYYRDRHYHPGERPNTNFVSDILVQQFGIDAARDVLQAGADGIAIYPSTHFCLDIAPNFAVHHFEGSWVDKARAISYKTQVMRRHHFEQIVESAPLDGIADMLDRVIKTYGLGMLFRALGRLWMSKLSKERERRQRRKARTSAKS